MNGRSLYVHFQYAGFCAPLVSENLWHSFVSDLTRSIHERRANSAQITRHFVPSCRDQLSFVLERCVSAFPPSGFPLHVVVDDDPRCVRVISEEAIHRRGTTPLTVCIANDSPEEPQW
jgi:hypothetical protein